MGTCHGGVETAARVPPSGCSTHHLCAPPSCWRTGGRGGTCVRRALLLPPLCCGCAWAAGTTYTGSMQAELWALPRRTWSCESAKHRHRQPMMCKCKELHIVEASSVVGNTREDYALAFEPCVSALVRHLSGTAHQKCTIVGTAAAGSVEPLRDAAAAAAAAGRLRQLLPCSCLHILVF